MNCIYNVLWLDDEPIKALEIIREEHPDMNFEKIDYVDECEDRLSNQSEKYHAVILDANGVSSNNPEKDANKKGFFSLVRHVIDCKIPLYIYSGQLLRASDGDTADVILEELHNLGLQDGKNIFQKSSGPYEMIKQIKSDLDANYYYYQGYEYILDFFSKGWIKRKYKSTFDVILEYYKNHNIDAPHGNQMRQSVEQMFECINSIIGITEAKNDRLSRIIEGLSHSYKRYSEGMKGPFKHMDEMPNEESHNALDEEMREMFFESDFSTFFLVTKWFHNLMLQLEKEGFTKIAEQPMKGMNTEATATLQDDSKPSKFQRPESKSEYDGLYEMPYEEKGQKYINLKVKVLYGDKSLENIPGKVLVTGIMIDKFTKNSWVTRHVNSIKGTNDE